LVKQVWNISEIQAIFWLHEYSKNGRDRMGNRGANLRKLNMDCNKNNSVAFSSQASHCSGTYRFTILVCHRLCKVCRSDCHSLCLQAAEAVWSTKVRV
jgi:hypothetical protein